MTRREEKQLNFVGIFQGKHIPNGNFHKRGYKHSLTRHYFPVFLLFDKKSWSTGELILFDYTPFNK